MKLQYVFGNPTSGKKKRRKKVAKKVKRKSNPLKTKLVAFEPVKIKNLKTGKVTKKKGKKAAQYTTKEVANKHDLAKQRTKLAKIKQNLAKLQIQKKKVKGKAAKKAVQQSIDAVKKSYNATNAKLKAKIKLRASELNALDGMEKNLKETGAIIEKETKYTGVPMPRKNKRRKKATKKKTRRKTKKKATRKKTKKKATKKKTRRKSTKRKASKKKTRRKSTKRKSSKKKATGRKKTRRKSKKKTTRKKATGRKKTKRRKRKVVTSKAIKKGYTLKSTPKKKRRSRRKKNPYFGGIVMKKSNPMSVAGMKVAGYDPMELAELATGGLFYGAANSYISPMFAKIPGLGNMAGMLGGTVPSLMAGIVFNIVSEKVNNKQAKQGLEFIGDGLLGAAVVGLGVHLSQTLLPAGMSGVDYIPGGSPHDSDFGGVDYTPDAGMMGVDFTPGASLPGHNQEADFGEYQESVADFGTIPEGLG